MEEYFSFYWEFHYVDSSLQPWADIKIIFCRCILDKSIRNCSRRDYNGTVDKWFYPLGATAGCSQSLPRLVSPEWSYHQEGQEVEWNECFRYIVLSLVMKKKRYNLWYLLFQSDYICLDSYCRSSCQCASWGMHCHVSATPPLPCSVDFPHLNSGCLQSWHHAICTTKHWGRPRAF